MHYLKVAAAAWATLAVLVFLFEDTSHDLGEKITISIFSTAAIVGAIGIATGVVYGLGWLWNWALS